MSKVPGDPASTGLVKNDIVETEYNGTHEYFTGLRNLNKYSYHQKIYTHDNVSHKLRNSKRNRVRCKV